MLLVYCICILYGVRSCDYKDFSRNPTNATTASPPPSLDRRDAARESRDGDRRRRDGRREGGAPGLPRRPRRVAFAANAAFLAAGYSSAPSAPPRSPTPRPQVRARSLAPAAPSALALGFPTFLPRVSIRFFLHLPSLEFARLGLWKLEYPGW